MITAAADSSAVFEALKASLSATLVTVSARFFFHCSILLHFHTAAHSRHSQCFSRRDCAVTRHTTDWSRPDPQQLYFHIIIDSPCTGGVFEPHAPAR